jgi:hypothetical protein
VRGGGTSREIRVQGLGSRTLRSRGRALRLKLGGVLVRAPKGAIRRGETLTLSVGGERGIARPPLRSLAGGPYRLTTSQGQPAEPVEITFPYDASLLPGGRPLILHGDRALRRWVPEATSVRARTVTTRLTSFSPLDVVDSITWGAGVLTGNRTDLPSPCGSVPPWIDGVTMSMDRNDPLPACISPDTTGDTLRVKLVNNRGAAQLISVSGASVDAHRSLWASSVERIVASGLARLATNGSGTRTFVLAPVRASPSRSRGPRASSVARS